MRRGEVALALVGIIWVVLVAGMGELWYDKVHKVEEQHAVFVFNEEVYVPPAMFTEVDLQVATMLIYFEARGEPEECQRLVLEVALNRVADRRFPSTLEDVVWQRRQFSFTHDGKHERYLDPAARDKSELLARDVLIGNGVDTTEGSLYYYNPKKADPYWKTAYQVTTECGDHVFLKEK